jgi:putative transposase
MKEKTKNWIDKVKQTKEKRKSQVCKVYELKFDKSHLSKEKLVYLNQLFLEAKWLYNSILSSEDIFKFDVKNKKVVVLDKDKNKIERELKVLSSQMRQAVHQKIGYAVKALSTKKKKGKQKEVGRLKFKSQINSIVLNQFGITYRIENEKYIFIQGFKKHFKVLGFKQIPENAEFANATLVRKCSEYYLKLTCFLPQERKKVVNKSIGLDFGIKDSVITSEGYKYFFNFPETKQLKKESRKMNKKVKGSSNRYKQKLKLQKEYNKISNKKKDCKNKFVSKLVNDNDIVVIQNEQIHNWAKSKMKGFGRRVQHSIMGGIISDLSKKSETVIIDRFFPSTKLCPECGCLNKIGLSDRVYVCGCGYIQDRDIHSAINILNQGLKQIGMEHINTMPVENKTSASFDLLKGVSYDSVKQEATSFRSW